MALFSNIRTLIGPLGRYLVVGAAGFAVGATAIYVYVVRSGPPLQHWHTVELSADFTAAQADDITTFEAYRELENRLLAQLSEEVYDRVGTGPAFTLARFSHGSAADPHTRTPNWNLSFELQTSSPRGGVLLLHGMSDSPYSLRAIGQALNERGYWVVGLRMPGHGTAPSGLRTVRNDDLAAAVKLGADHVVSRVGSRPMHIVGYSTGATLAVDYVLDILSGGGGRHRQAWC